MSTIASLFLDRVRLSGHRPALREKQGGRWVTRSWSDWHETSRGVAAALASRGVAAGDRVAIMGRTRRAWFEADMGVQLAAGVTVPIYPTVTEEQAGFVLDDSGSKVVFVDDPAQGLLVAHPGVTEIVCFDGRATRDVPGLDERRVVLLDDLRQRTSATVTSFPDFVASGAEALEHGAEYALAARLEALRSDDLSTLVYTSGTSGPPKGVMLTHDNFAFEVSALAGQMHLGEHDEQLLFLPLAHIFGRILEIAQLEVGFVTAFAESLWKAVDNMTEIQPTFFGSVPRLFEKVHELALHRAAREGNIRRRVFDWSIDRGRDVSRRRRRGLPIPPLLAAEHRYADKLALRPIRERFGSRLRFALSGAAPLAPELAEWFHAVGVTILEGYGLTETTSATHVSRPDRFDFGFVGPAVPGVEAKIGDGGEILVRGRNVMKGYWNRPDETRDAFDADGFFRTGDVGFIDPRGFLEITDRKKDLIVTSGGKNVSPQNVEAILAESPFIAHAVVYGDKRKHLVALVTLDEASVFRWAREHDRPRDLEALCRDAEVRALIRLEVDRANKRLAQYETIKRFAILPRAFSEAAGELTPTSKVRRRVIIERNAALLDSLYDEPASPSP